MRLKLSDHGATHWIKYTITTPIACLPDGGHVLKLRRRCRSHYDRWSCNVKSVWIYSRHFDRAERKLRREKHKQRQQRLAQAFRSRKVQTRATLVDWEEEASLRSATLTFRVLRPLLFQHATSDHLILRNIVLGLMFQPSAGRPCRPALLLLHHHPC